MAALALALKERLKGERQSIIAAFEAQHKPEALLADLRRSVDGVLGEAWQSFGFPADTALVAVGGYGRGELFPHSDVDVLVLLGSPADAALRGKLEELVQLFWDIGLEIGHSIRTIDECLTESAADITVQTSLLEARFVTGNRKLYRFLCERLAAAMDPQAFFQAKTLELRQRHVKYEDTPYSLEPNVKESPGGLRDLQVILWVAKAAGLGDSWRKLAERGLITPTEARQLTRTERVFKDIRIRLHLHSRRREDRLVFDVQTPLAESFGFKTSETRRASEFLMQHYYWAAKAATQLNTILLQNIGAQLFPQPGEPHPINERFNEVNGLIDIARDDTFETTPSTMLEVFLLRAQHPEIKGMTARTLRALWHARFAIDSRFRRDPANRALFLQILQAPQGITHALRAHEPDQRARALPAELPPHHRPDAARPVPCLYRGPAHPDGGAQRAPLHHERARARISVLQPADGRLRPALAAVHRRPLPRHRQGPRRRPFASWAWPTPAASARTTACRRKTPSWWCSWSSIIWPCRRSRKSRTCPILK